MSESASASASAASTSEAGAEAELWSAIPEGFPSALQAALQETLAALAEREGAFTERFYERFFEKRPDVRPLFGPYSLAEQEEMMGETLKSMLALSEQAPWLSDNLVALGRSHFEYGVTTDMYLDFVDVLVESAAELLGDDFSKTGREALRGAAAHISSTMATAGEEVAADSR